MTEEENPFKINKYEIIFKVVNSVLAGALIILGAFTSGTITIQAFIAALTAAVISAIIQFKEYWATQEKEYGRTQKVWIGKFL